MARTVLRLVIAVGWLFWLVVGWLLLLTLGFGQRHEILATTAVFVVVPVILLSIHQFAWRAVRLQTLIWVTGVGSVLVGLVALATVMDWIGVRAQ